MEVAGVQRTAEQGSVKYRSEEAGRDRTRLHGRAKHWNGRNGEQTQAKDCIVVAGRDRMAEQSMGMAGEDSCVMQIKAT